MQCALYYAIAIRQSVCHMWVDQLNGSGQYHAVFTAEWLGVFAG